MSHKLMNVDCGFFDERSGCRGNLEIVEGVVVCYVFAGEGTYFVYGLALGEPFVDESGQELVRVGPFPEEFDLGSFFDRLAGTLRVGTECIRRVPFDFVGRRDA